MTMKNRQLAELQPQAVWSYFKEWCGIPHISRHEEKAIAYLKQFAIDHQLSCSVDKAGNVIIRKPATHGMENRKTLILQAHMDMVGESIPDKKHDFLNDPIDVYIDGDWVKANGTTLGADNGIGLAMILAIFDSDDIQHGPLEALFTVSEEIGLKGMMALESGMLQGELFLNLDSEKDGELCVGCAGHTRTDITIPYETELAPKQMEFFAITVSGLHGGHSGFDIHFDRANAVKLLTRLLLRGMYEDDMRLAHLDAGTVHNAIPSSGHAIVAVLKDRRESFLAATHQLIKTLQTEYQKVDPDLKITLQDAKKTFLINRNAQQDLLNALLACPHGVISMSQDIDDLVHTSVNLAHVKSESGRFIIYVSQRSLDQTSQHKESEKVKNIFEQVGANVEIPSSYPGWTPNLNSPFFKLCENIFAKQYHEKPKHKAIHAGLECSLMGLKYPHVDMLSIGPEIQNVHTVRERVSISSVARLWQVILQLLKEIPTK